MTNQPTHHVLLDEDVYQPFDFAQLVGVHHLTVINWLKKENLKGWKIGGRYYVAASELTRLRKSTI
jgi:hypothetical protein